MSYRKKNPRDSKNEFKSAMVNKPSVFESLKIYRDWIWADQQKRVLEAYAYMGLVKQKRGFEIAQKAQIHILRMRKVPFRLLFPIHKYCIQWFW